MISLSGVSVEYENGVRALNDVSLSIAKGEFAFVVGATGSGKSTLLRLLYREMLPSKGVVTVGGDDVTALRPDAVPFLRRKLGIVFQDFSDAGAMEALTDGCAKASRQALIKKNEGQEIFDFTSGRS